MCQNLLFLAPTEALGERRLIEAPPDIRPPACVRLGGTTERAVVAWTPAALSTVQVARSTMNPEIRAILFGLLMAALASAVIISLFYSP